MGALMGEWQPIETAPIDLMILLWDGEAVQTGRYYNPMAAPGTPTEPGYGEWFDSRGYGYEYEVFGVGELKPTHWMPLPEPPRD